MQRGKSQECFLRGRSLWVSAFARSRISRIDDICTHLKGVLLSRMLGKERIDTLTPEQKAFARTDGNGLSLKEVVEKYEPTILIGVTAVGGLFTEDLIREMAKRVARPIIFPLSNPTTKAECTAEQAFEWSDGRCIFASGSPFDPVEMEDGKIYYTSQCNNSKFADSKMYYNLDPTCLTTASFHSVYIFPGIGLGASVCGAKKITDRMLYVAAKALAECVPQDAMERGQVFPHISSIRQVSHRIAIAVIEEAMRQGLATKISSEDAENLDEFVARKMYYPEYVPLVEKGTFI